LSFNIGLSNAKRSELVFGSEKYRYRTKKALTVEL